MPHVVAALKRSSSSYSHCPLKKRPLKYDPAEDTLSDSDQSSKGLTPPPIHTHTIITPPPSDHIEPENLSTKPEDLRLAGKEKSLPSPPPISLVAGRGHGNSQNYHHYQHTNAPSYFGGGKYVVGFAPNYSQVSHPIKSLSGGPLEPIHLNPQASWPEMNSYGNGMRHFSTGGSRLSPEVMPQFPSHLTPMSVRRDSGSPPHVSPPLSLEPAYPVLRIEESHRSRLPSSSPTHQTDLILDNMKRERDILLPIRNQSQIHHHHHHNLEDCDDRATEKLPYHIHHHHQLSPSYSSESRDSVISHGKGSNTQNISMGPSPNSTSETAIVPTNVNGGSRYQCPNCSKSYSTYSGMTKHLQFHCATQNKKSFACRFCQKVYVSLGALKMHIRTHTLPCKCLTCGKAFSRPWLLQGHIRTHTGEKPFSCQHCHRAFADRSNLRAHLQTHSEVKKYSCKCCSKTFSRMSLLVKHEEGGCNASPMSFSHSE